MLAFILGHRLEPLLGLTFPWCLWGSKGVRKGRVRESPSITLIVGHQWCSERWYQGLHDVEVSYPAIVPYYDDFIQWTAIESLNKDEMTYVQPRFREKILYAHPLQTVHLLEVCVNYLLIRLTKRLQEPSFHKFVNSIACSALICMWHNFCQVKECDNLKVSIIFWKYSIYYLMS